MSEPSSPVLGRLSVVDPRKVWAHEALHFTPWLLENVDVLGDLLGMDLALEVAEHPVGGFSLDLLGRDLQTDGVVIVENQLETSDHTHLGQILTYAAGTDPTTIVWVAAQFRPEHRAALDWLNERTDEDTRFFGVQVGVVRIGESTPAPNFKLVVQPNDWEKTVRAATKDAEATGKQALYRDFWTRWIALIKQERPTWSSATQAPRAGWFSMKSGVSWVAYCASFTKQGLACELNFEDPDPELNSARLSSLEMTADRFEASYGCALNWQPLPGRKMTRVAEYLHAADVTRVAEWDDYLDWMLDRQTRMRRAVAAAGGIPAVDPA